MNTRPLISLSARHRHRGFTLVELLVTLTVLVILLSLAVPSFSETLRQWRRDSATKALTAHLQLARAEAIKTSRKVELCPSSNGTSCADSNDWKNGWLVFVDLNGNDALDDGELIAVRGASPGIASMTATNDVKKLVFLSNGLLGAGTTVITVKAAGSSTTKVNEIDISRVGRAQVTSKSQS